MAYKEYGFFRVLQNSKFFDKNRGVNSLKAAIADFQKVLDADRSREDIASQIDVCKEKIASTIGHH